MKKNFDQTNKFNIQIIDIRKLEHSFLK